MAEKIRLKIPPAVAAFVRPGVGSEEKLKGVEAAAGLPPDERVLLLFCLMRDADDTVKGAAATAFELLPAEPLLAFVRRPVSHPAILDEIARIHHSSPGVIDALLESDALSPQARQFLRSRALVDEEPPEGDGEAGEEQAEAVEEEGEEFLSKYKMSQLMGIAEKIKMALSGDKEWRSILIKDANKLVSGSVIKNPRITETEILSLVKAGVQNDEIMRLICANKEWVKNCKIRKALVENPRTPVPNALRYLATLGEKDIAAYAKSKNISSVISTQAKRLLLNKKR
ncbi:MAG: hypothetical protein HYV06_06350 [Deltaproteobacteria bacterium]|nr:hypothetical protein [Deltaproteobacteria bacterium]